MDNEEEQQAAKSEDLEESSKGSELQQEAQNFAEAINKEKISTEQKRKRSMMQPIKKQSLHGNILDLVSKRMAKKEVRRAKTQVEIDDDYLFQFVPDIDNFEGVKDVRNYCISSINDNGYLIGEQSFGVLQMFNKHSKIDKDDLVRIQHFSKFMGSLAVKARDITAALTLIISMTQLIGESNGGIYNLDSTPGLGPFSLLALPFDLMLKHMNDHEASRSPNSTPQLTNARR